MRDLAKETPAVNGSARVQALAASLLTDDEAPEAPAEVRQPEPEVVRKIAEARQDQSLAHIAGLMVRATRALEPVVALLSRRLLGWATLGAGVGLAIFAMREPQWERLAVLAVFMILAPWLVRNIG